MYKLFIADDEQEIREGLKCILDWEALGFTLCAEARNGEEALNGILDTAPDLVLLDIRMPKLTGIDVAREARSQGFAGHFVILSGYSDFNYARTLIPHNVDGYLTKPIDEEDLLATIHTVVKRLQQEQANTQFLESYREAAKNALLTQVVTGALPADTNPEYLAALELRLKELQLDAKAYQVVIYENFSKEVTGMAYSLAQLLNVSHQGASSFDHISSTDGEILLLKGRPILERFSHALTYYENIPQKGSPLDSLFLAYGQVVYEPKDISLSYGQASRLMKRRFFCVQGQHTLDYTQLPWLESKSLELSEDMLKEYAGFFIGYIQSYNRKKMAEKLHELEQYLYNVKNDIEEVKLFLTDLYLRIKEKISHIYSATAIPFPSNASVIDVIGSKYYLYEILQLLSEQFERTMSAAGNPSRNSILDDVLYYIDRNFRENIKLESIAPLFGYHSAYLGKIFHKAVGMNFNSYLDRQRIEASKKLLEQNSLKVYEIASQVGYGDIDYFHKKFKKYVGCSPAEYRKSRKEHTADEQTGPPGEAEKNRSDE
ncbi:MAG: response regulator transcription factor [Clostridium sp.]|nr:response regulator transcription factor [Clostridium sp.]